jgi:hypothetical protein
MDLSELIRVLHAINTNVLPFLENIQKQIEEEPEREDELREYANRAIDIAMDGINTAVANLRRQIQPKQPEEQQPKNLRNNKKRRMN